MCSKNPMQEELKHSYLENVRMKLVAEAKLESVKLITDMRSEVPYSFNYFYCHQMAQHLWLQEPQTIPTIGGMITNLMVQGPSIQVT